MRSFQLAQARQGSKSQKGSLTSFKPKIPRALEGEHTDIALGEHSELAPVNVQLHPIAALHLEGNIIGGVVACVMHRAAAGIVHVRRNVRAL